MAVIRCKLSYHSLVGDKLTTFAVNVRNGIYGDITTFPAPPEPEPVFQLKITNFVNKHSAYKGHTATKTEMEAALTVLMDGLDAMSTYVNTIANGDATIIGLANFVPTKGSASEQVPPAKPSGVTLVRTDSGELTSDCTVVAGAEFYGAFLTAANQLPSAIVINDGGQIIITNDDVPAGALTTSTLRMIADLNKSRRKKFKNLQAGITYWVYYYAGNSAGVSSISEGVSFLLW